ncbi:MAG: sigma-70 family RNA polymerase sigma factor [Anaerolineae bacterium]|jgi:RNA polymerase sigma-70 factor (ECF subfamily)
MGRRTNQEWIAALKGPQRDQALDELRKMMLEGLRYTLTKRYDVPEIELEDFAQEALLKILRGLDSFRGESRFTTWAHKIALNVAFTELRRRRWKNVSLQDLTAQYDEAFTPAALTDPDPSPERAATQRLLMDAVERAIAEELTERQRQALIAVVVGGMPPAEVARRMGSNRNALYKLVHDARLKLKRRLLASGLSAEEILTSFEQRPMSVDQRDRSHRV